jgi:nucleoid-associated protein YgaU
VSKTHKLLIAVALLASGYGLALVWNATADFLWPNSGVGSGAGERAALMFEPSLAVAPPTTSPAQLVPVSQVDQAAAGIQTTPTSANGNSLAATTAAERPTWLSAGPPAKVVSVAAGNGAPADQPKPAVGMLPVASNDIPAIANDQRDIPTATPFPRAEITAVKPIQDSASADASPWDRWPKWEPAAVEASAAAPAVAAEQSGKPANGVIAASAQQLILPSSGPAAFQATFIASEPTVKNQPSNRLVPVPQPLAQADDDDEGPRTHAIVDGDSLAKLAERFLGDPQLANQIYDLNRDVLSSPDLLPIGAELKLPPRPAFAAKSPAQTSYATGATTSRPPGLVPVEDVRKAFVGMPRAQLLRPLPPTQESTTPATTPSYATTER